MAREKIGDDLMQVRFPDGTFAAIDAVSGNRSDFIRQAVAGALSSSAPIERPVARCRCPDGYPVHAWHEPCVGDDQTSAPQKNSFESSGRQVGKSLSSRQGDMQAILEFARGRKATSREVEAAMRWLGLRYTKAEKALLADGRIAFLDGVMVCI